MAKTTKKDESDKKAVKTATATKKTAEKKSTSAKQTLKKTTKSAASANSTTKKTNVTQNKTKPSAKTTKTTTSSKTTSQKAATTKTPKVVTTKAPKTNNSTSKKTIKRVSEKDNVQNQIEQSNKELHELLKNQEGDNSLYHQIPEKNKNDKKKKVVKYAISSAVILAIIILIILCAKKCSGNNKTALDKERQNTIQLAKKYMQKGQLDPAMELLNKLLISNANDEEVNNLLDQLIELKAKQERDNVPTVTVISPENNANIDTSEITNAFKDTIDSMSRELSAANEANAKNQEALNRLLEAQREDEKERQKEAKAQELQRKQEEAKRKAEEERLAKESKQLAEKIAKINELINLGNASLNTGKSSDAVKKYEEAVKLLPVEQGEPKFSASKYSEISSNLYDAADREKNPQEKSTLMDNAVKYAKMAIEKDPANARAHFILAMDAESKKQSQEAENQLELAVKNDPNNYLYYYYLGRRQQINGKYQQARSSYTSSIKINNSFDSAHFNLGLTCNKLNLKKDALASFRKAYTVNPQHEKAYLEEARLLNKSFKDLQGAIASYNKVLSIEPDNMAALKECGSVYAELDNYAKAETLFRRVVAKLGSSSDPMTYYNLSTVLYNQNKFEDALKNAKIAYDTKDNLRTPVEKSVVAYQYALTTEKTGDITTAILYYKEALSLNPSHTKAKINLGIMFMEMNPPDTDTALTFLNAAYQEDKNNFEVNNNLGNAYLLKKEYSNAINYYLNASKLKSRDVNVKTNLAKAYAESGQFDNAKTTYIEVINLNPNSYDSYIEVAKVCIALKDTISAEGYLKALQNKKPEYKATEVKQLIETVAN